MSDLDGLRSLYEKTAPFYEQHILPVFGVLAADFAAWALRCACAHLNYELYDAFDVGPLSSPQQLKRLELIDLGTGTGTLARAFALHVDNVLGVDLSMPMLTAAQQAATAESHTNLRWLQADLHHLPLRRGSINMAVSSFGLNASTPKRSLKAVANVLRRGEGMLAFQEWGVEDECSRIVDETLGAHTPDNAPEIDPVLRNFFDAPKPWYDQLQDADDFYSLLKDEMGFDLVWAKEAAFTKVHLPNLDSFIASKMAWASRRNVLAAMTASGHDAFYADLRNRLRPYLNPDGSFDWSPDLFRVFAIR